MTYEEKLYTVFFTLFAICPPDPFPHKCNFYPQLVCYLAKPFLAYSVWVIKHVQWLPFTSQGEALHKI